MIALTTVAARRAVARARRTKDEGPPIPVIDGVREPEPAELDARPQHEANASPGRLVSEADDVVGDSERW